MSARGCCCCCSCCCHCSSARRHGPSKALGEHEHARAQGPPPSLLLLLFPATGGDEGVRASESFEQQRSFGSSSFLRPAPFRLHQAPDRPREQAQRRGQHLLLYRGRRRARRRRGRAGRGGRSVPCRHPRRPLVPCSSSSFCSSSSSSSSSDDDHGEVVLPAGFRVRVRGALREKEIAEVAVALVIVVVVVLNGTSAASTRRRRFPQPRGDGEHRSSDVVHGPSPSAKEEKNRASVVAAMQTSAGGGGGEGAVCRGGHGEHSRECRARRHHRCTCRGSSSAPSPPLFAAAALERSADQVEEVGHGNRGDDDRGCGVAIVVVVVVTRDGGDKRGCQRQRRGKRRRVVRRGRDFQGAHERRADHEKVGGDRENSGSSSSGRRRRARNGRCRRCCRRCRQRLLPLPFPLLPREAQGPEKRVGRPQRVV